MADFIEPMTDGLLTVKVEEPAGTPRDDASVTASVYGPKGGSAIATDVLLAARGSGTGLYDLEWNRTWTTTASRGVPGEYLVVVRSVRGTSPNDVVAVKHIRVPVRWTDDS